MLTPRLQGVDPISPIQTPQVNVPEQDLSGVQQVAINALNRTGQNVQQSNAANAEIYSQITQNIANTDNYRELANSFRRQPSGDGSGIAAIGQTVTGILDVYRQLQEQRREHLRGKALVSLEEERQQLLTDAESVLRSSEGYTGYQARIRDLLGRYQEYLSPQDVIETTAMLYRPAQDVMREQAQARYGTFEQIYNNNRETLQAQAVIQFESRFQALANARTPQQAQDLLQQISTEIDEFTSQLPPLEAGILARRLYESVEENYRGRVGEFEDLRLKLTQYQEFAVAAQQALESYNQHGDLMRYQADIYFAELQYDQPHNSIFRNPNVNIEAEYEALRRSNYIRQSAEERQISYAESIVFDEAQIATLAYKLYTDPASRPILEGIFAGNDYFESATILAESLREYYDTQREVTQQNAGLAIQAQNLTTRSNEDFLSWFTSNETSTTLEALGIGALFNDNLRSALGNLQNPQTRAQASPEQIQEWQTAILESRSAIQELIQTQINNNNTRLDLLRGRLAPYGIDSQDGLRRLAETAPATMESIYQAAEEARLRTRLEFDPSVPPPTASQPNFERPQLATIRRGNAEVILPFAPNTQFDWNADNYGEQRGNRRHAGEDIALPVGTDLLWYGTTQGRVVRVENDPDGYGLYVDIRSDDGSLHRFAHLANSNVSEGDIVNPGQFFADSGNSGSSEGPHLHWEIRPQGGSEFGFNGTTDVIQYMSQFANGGRQTRNNSRNADVPPNALQVNRDFYILGNQVVDRRTGTAAPLEATNNNPLRRNFASTRREDYNNDPSQNYGYEVLATDRTFRVELHRMASRLGVPAQWIADVMAYESAGFNPAARNRRTNATGLIQFMPRTAQNLGTSVDALRRMSRTQQLRYVEEYLKPFAQRGQLRSPYAVLMAVFSNPQNVVRLLENPQSVRRVGDGDINFEQYSRRLGSNAGREYTPLYGRPATHTTYHGSCSVCQSLIRSGSSIVPHEAG